MTVDLATATAADIDRLEFAGEDSEAETRIGCALVLHWTPRENRERRPTGRRRARRTG